MQTRAGQDFGYVMIQSYEVELQRCPTLKNISVKAGNTELMTGFQNLTMAYELRTTADRVVISGTPLEEGCTVLVDQNAFRHCGTAGEENL